MTMAQTSVIDRTVVPVEGAHVVLDAALATGSPRAAALQMRDLAPMLDLDRAREASMNEGQGVVVAIEPRSAALAVRWLPAHEPTTIHNHGSWGAAVVVDGADRYERFTVADGGAALDATFWLEAGDLVWWLDPPADLHRQVALDSGALELVLLAEPRPRNLSQDFTEIDVLGDARPLADALLTAYLDRSFAPLRPHYDADVLADLNVPSWRLQIAGRDEFEQLFDHEELGQNKQRLRAFRAFPTTDGCVVEIEASFRHDEETRLWRDIHVLRTRDGNVSEHLVYCTGFWDAATIAKQAADARMVRP
jgi:hypothetical protein